MGTVQISRQAKYKPEEYTDLEMPSDDMDDYLENYHSKLVKVRKETKCHYCGTTIKAGDQALSEKCFIDGKPYYIHDCLDCVEDVIKGWDDEAQARWEQRAKKSGYV
jgi:hypothetical protein